jgi:hypothetical protein
MRKTQEIRRQFDTAIAEGSEHLMGKASFALETSQLGRDDFPENNFLLAVEIMQSPEFLAAAGNWVLFGLFEHDWGKLSDDQKSRLLEVIEQIYPRLTDEMPRFALTVLLGEYFCDEQALAVVGRLTELADEAARCVLPHGFEHIARGSTNSTLIASAIRMLDDMRRDTSELVRCRAALSFGRLVDRGIIPPDSTDERQ